MELDTTVQSLCPIRIDTGQGIFTVPQPTVKQALLLHGLLPFWEDSGYADRIKDVIDEWLPASVKAQFDEIRWDYRINIFVQLLRACEPDAETKETDEPGEPEDIGLVLADYRLWFKSDVLAEPWGFFLHQAKCLPKAKAHWELSNATWYISAKDEKSFENLLVRAGYRKEQEVEEIGFNYEEELRRARAMAEMDFGI